MVTYSSADNTRCENSLWKGKLHCPELFFGEQTELRLCKLGPGMVVFIFEVVFILAGAVSVPVGWCSGGGLAIVQYKRHYFVISFFSFSIHPYSTFLRSARPLWILQAVRLC